MNPFKKLFDNISPFSFKDSLNKIDMNPALPIFKLYKPDQDKTEENHNNYLDSLTDWLFCDN